MVGTSTLTADDLAITASTLGNPSFGELLAAASAGGFRGLSIWPVATYERARAEGLDDKTMRLMLDDAGMVVQDVDAQIAWVGPGDPGPPYREEPSLAVFLAAADALGVRSANVLLVGPPERTLDDAAEAYAGLCDRFAEHDLVTTLEFSGHGSVTNLLDALEVARRTGRPNARVLIDTWHLHWGPTEPDDLRNAEGALVAAVQVNDVPADRPTDPVWASRNARLAPGDGAMDLVGFVRDLRASGCEAPLTVEVFNDALLASRGAAEHARLLAAAMRDIVGQATLDPPRGAP